VFLQGIGRGKITALTHVLEAPAYFGFLYFGATRAGIGAIATIWTARIVLNTAFTFGIVRISFSDFLPKPSILSAMAGLILLLSIACSLPLSLFWRAIFFTSVGSTFLVLLVTVLMTPNDKQAIARQWQRFRAA
ncbi:MAG: hypothetical protein AAFY15_17050, partial [Cyanobacteria bacterium J06648_11]